MGFVQKVKNVFKSIKNSYKRFPITIAISTALVIMLIILSERSPYLTADSRTIFERVNMIIALGIPLSLCIKLVYEKNHKLNKIHEILLYIFGGVILLLYYFFLLKDLKMVSMTRYIGVSIFLYLAFSYIPWLGRKEDFEFYIIKMFSSFFLTVIYSLVLYLGISAIFFTINQLFNANIPGKYYYYIFLIVAGIFAPSLFLARNPEVGEDFNGYAYPKSLKALLLYIVMPLITVYSTILYVYFLKIIITRNWPQGLVSHLVLWYSVISVAVIFFITPILDENRWANRFKIWFSKLIIPILIMMFISMGIRIKEYGITENRYFVVALGLWVFGIMLYYGFSKKLNNIIIPIFLSLIAINSVFGPLSSFSISKLSQNRRLEYILMKNNMLENNKIIKAPEDMPIDDKMETGMILKYFENNHSLEDVKYLPKDFKIGDMETVFGFPYGEKNLYQNNYFFYNLDYTGKAFEIMGYDYFLENYSIMGKTITFDDIDISYDGNDFKFKIMEKGNNLYEANLKDYVVDIMKKHEKEKIHGKNLLDLNETTVIDENDKVKVKFIITNFGGRTNTISNEPIIENIDYYVLIEIK